MVFGGTMGNTKLISVSDKKSHTEEALSRIKAI